MLDGKGKGKQGEQGGEEGLVGNAGVHTDEVVNGEDGKDDEDQFGQLVGGHRKYLGFRVSVSSVM